MNLMWHVTDLQNRRSQKESRLGGAGISDLGRADDVGNSSSCRTLPARCKPLRPQSEHAAVAVGFGEGSHCFDAELFASADDAQAICAIGYENF
jgi:hypothetical protein